MPELSGTGRLADDLYLIAHHDVSGKPFLQPRALGLGLAGALLAELVIAGRIRIGPDAVTVTNATPPDEELARTVLGQILGEAQRHPVQTWLQFLGRTATAEVAERLYRSGYLEHVSQRLPWRGDRWVPVNSDSAFAAFVRVRSVLDASRSASASGAILAGLAQACGLGSRLSVAAPSEGRRRSIEEAVRELGPDLLALIAQTRAAVDSALLSQRV
ncbi:MAG TPA: GPP34 family phosphoprotein [Streptosporangiaceae bacterium]|nr:GPP34 family phosphoprotein [Streptosporangiaceae bacterium]